MDTIKDLIAAERPLYLDTFICLSVANYLLVTCVLNFTNLHGEVTRKGTSQTTYMSYQYLSLLTTSYCSYLGWYGWLYDRGNVDEDHTYGRSETCIYLGHIMCGYQLWNLLLCAFIEEYRTPDFLGHHITTAILSYSIPKPFVNYYALFFIGIAETSNFPLSIMDIIKGLQWQAIYPTFNKVVQYTFAASFYVLRVFIWPYASYLFWVDAIDSFHMVHSKAILIFFLFANTGLSLLQFFWGWKILKRALIDMGCMKLPSKKQKKQN